MNIQINWCSRIFLSRIEIYGWLIVIKSQYKRDSSQKTGLYLINTRIKSNVVAQYYDQLFSSDSKFLNRADYFLHFAEKNKIWQSITAKQSSVEYYERV